MTDIKEKQNHFSKLKCIAISWHFNKPTGKEHLLLFVAIVAWIFPGLVFFKHSLWGGLLFFFFVAGSYAFLAFPGNDSNLMIVFYVQIMPDDLVMQLHRF